MKKGKLLTILAIAISISIISLSFQSSIMEKKIIKTSGAPAPIGPYNQGVMVGDLLFVSGQIAADPATGALLTEDIKQEAKQVMDNIGAVLNEAGLNYDHVVKSTIYLSNMDNFSSVNEVYGSYFGEDAPARETVEVSRLPKDVNVEISVIAVR